MNTSVENRDKLPIGLAILSNALPPIGFYLSLKYRSEFPSKARTALINALLGIPIGLVGGYLLQTFLI